LQQNVFVMAPTPPKTGPGVVLWGHPDLQSDNASRAGSGAGDRNAKPDLKLRKLLFTLALALTPFSAKADVLDFAGRQWGAVQQSQDHQLDSAWKMVGAAPPEAPLPLAESTPGVWIAPLPRKLAAPAPLEAKLTLKQLPMQRMPVKRALPAPSVEKAPKKLFCVEFARNLSGLAIFGDAKYWWARAKNLYARASHPVEEAVMVFSGSARLKKGHVAVVSQIISPREIRVEQANWMNKGEIDHGTPVLDVSVGNDWSKVRVWDVPSQQFGSVYAVSGFILKPLVREAAND